MNANRMEKITDYDEETEICTLTFATRDERFNLTEDLAGQLCYLDVAIEPLAHGYGWIGGVYKLLMKSPAIENIAVGDSVGIYRGNPASASCGQAVKGGLFACIKVSGWYCWVIPNVL